MKHVFIVNPAAGKTNQFKMLSEKIAQCFEVGTYLILETKCKGDATHIAKRFAQMGEDICLYACGGDGTINEVLNGIYQYPNACLGIIPIGTGNDFIKSIPSLEKKHFLDINAYVDGVKMPCDIIVVNDKALINTASVGLDVSIASNVEKFKKLPLLKGRTPYYLGLLNSMFSSMSKKLKIVIDGEVYDYQEYTFVVVCNGKYYGGGYCPCPDAIIDDGYMDICMIKKVSRNKILRLSGKYKKGTHIEYDKLVNVKRAKTIQIIADEKVFLNLDGEVISKTNPHIKLIPNGVTLYLPNVFKDMV